MKVIIDQFRSSYKTIIKQSIVIAFVSIGLAVLYNSLSASGIPWIGSWENSNKLPNPGGRCAPKSELSKFDSMYEKYYNGLSIFVDARTDSLYAQGHISGAISFPLATFDAHIEEFISLHPFDQDIVVYCSGLDCYDSHDLAQYLQNHGFTRVSVYAEGYPDWVKRGLPTREGMSP